jgi:hypothetical protein
MALNHFHIDSYVWKYWIIELKKEEYGRQINIEIYTVYSTMWTGQVLTLYSSTLPNAGVYVHWSFWKWIKAYLCCHSACQAIVQLLFPSMSVLCTCPQSEVWSRPWAEGVCFSVLESTDRSELRTDQGASRYPSPEKNKHEGFHIRCLTNAYKNY